MKKLITFILLFTAVSLNCLAVSETAIYLHHGDNVTIFEGTNQLQAALNAADDGDILYLGEGSYYGNLNITKKIFIKGAGENKTQINGNLSVNIDDDEDIVEYNEPIVEGVYVTNYINLYGNTKGLIFRKCDCHYFQVASGTHKDITLDRCIVWNNFNNSNNMEGLNIINSKIYEFAVGCTSGKGTRDDIVIDHCNIWQISGSLSYLRGTMRNSIIGTYYYDYSSYNLNICYMNFHNNIIHSKLNVTSSCKSANIYKYDSPLVNGSSGKYATVYNCSISKESRLENKHLADDNTVIGCDGGATPFTLTMSTPQVDAKNSTFEVDNAAKKLNVKINLVGTASE